jgi:GAF domain-containing protein
MATTDMDILEAVQDLQSRLVPGDLDSTLHAITQAAVEVMPGVDHASLSLRHTDGSLNSYAVTGDVIVRLDERQFELHEGPCYDGATSNPFVVSADLLTDPRYPQYGPFAANLGIRSQAGIRLFENGKTVAALNLFGAEIGAIQNVAALSRLFAHQAAVALAYSMEIQGLHDALSSRTRIGQAVGIIMERYKLPEEQAFAFLTRLSQHGNIKLRRIADELVATTPKR